MKSACTVVRELDESMLSLFALVKEALSAATEIFLAADRDAARALVEQDRVIDRLHRQSRDLAVQRLLGPDELDTTTKVELLLILGMLPELERSGDLAEHIASHAVQGLAKWLTPRGRRLVTEMGELGCEMWATAAEAYQRRDGSVAEHLRRRDDEIDDLHVSLTSELAAAQVTVPVAIEMALVARYFERLGDHAVNVIRQVQLMNEARHEAQGGDR